MIQYEPEDYYTVFTLEEVAEYLRIKNVRIVAGWVKEGKLKAKKIGRRWLVTKAALKEFVSPDEQIMELKYVECPLGIDRCIHCAYEALKKEGK